MTQSTTIDSASSPRAPRTPSARSRPEEALSSLFDPETRFEQLTELRLRVRVKCGEAVLRLVQDVQRPLFHQIRRRYCAQLIQIDSYSEYQVLLAQILQEAEARFHADPLIRDAGLADTALFETLVDAMKVQLSAALETWL